MMGRQPMLCLSPETEHKNFSNINGNWHSTVTIRQPVTGELDSKPFAIAHNGGHVPATKGVTINH